MSSGELSARDRATLGHIARYRLTFREIVGQLYFEGADPQKALDRLRAEGYISTRKGFGRNRTAYQLAPRGTAVVGVNRRRAEPLGSEALPVHLAILAFCFLQQRSRLKLETSELDEIFEHGPPSGRYHCLERRGKAARLYHIYVPGDSTRPVEVVAMTHRHIEEVLGMPGLIRWLQTRVYWHAVLVNTAPRAAELQAMFDEALLTDERPLRPAARVHVQCVPGYDELEEGLRGLA